MSASSDDGFCAGFFTGAVGAVLFFCMVTSWVTTVYLTAGVALVAAIVAGVDFATPVGRARRRRQREINRRTSVYITAGLREADAAKRADSELHDEAREVLSSGRGL